MAESKNEMLRALDLVRQKEERGRVLSEIFLELPEPEEYPDYYERINYPIALNDIQAKVERNAYSNVSEFRKDFQTMTSNAQIYNKKSSMVYKDSVILQTLFDSLFPEPQEEKRMTKVATPTAAKLEVKAANGDGIDYKSVIKTIKSLKDSDGRVISEIFMELPDAAEYPNYYEEIKKPIALDGIMKKIKDKKYKSVAEFEGDFLLMCGNAQIYNAEGSQVYEDASTMQFKFLQLMGKQGAAMDTTAIETVKHGDHTYTIGDYVQVVNPGNPLKPTIIQITAAWVENTGAKRQGITGIWFLRPEQTTHKATHKFMENEVFKTNHTEHYYATDIVAPACVLFYKDYIQGKPKDLPFENVFVCESRYNEIGKSYNKIKVWTSGLPETLKIKTKELAESLEMYNSPLVPKRVLSDLVKDEPHPLGKKRKMSHEVGGDVATPDAKVQKMLPKSEPSKVAGRKNSQSISTPITNMQQVYRQSPGVGVTSAPPMRQNTNYVTPATLQRLQYQQQQQQQQQQRIKQQYLGGSPAAATAWGGMGNQKDAEVISIKTAEHFLTTDKKQIAWFPAPPAAVYSLDEGVVHSLEYLVNKKDTTTKPIHLPSPTHTQDDVEMVDTEIPSSTIFDDVTSSQTTATEEAEDWAPVASILHTLADTWLKQASMAF